MAQYILCYDVDADYQQGRLELEKILAGYFPAPLCQSTYLISSQESAEFIKEEFVKAISNRGRIVIAPFSSNGTSVSSRVQDDLRKFLAGQQT